MSILGEFREFFDGTRERKLELARLADEKEWREQTREIRGGIEGFVKGGAWDELRDQIIGAAAATMPSPDIGLDSAGAFWYRRGLEQAINMLDNYVASALEE